MVSFIWPLENLAINKKNRSAASMNAGLLRQLGYFQQLEFNNSCVYTAKQQENWQFDA
jgi:phage pi2 protein 07